MRGAGDSLYSIHKRGRIQLMATTSPVLLYGGKEWSAMQPVRPKCEKKMVEEGKMKHNVKGCTDFPVQLQEQSWPERSCNVTGYLLSLDKILKIRPTTWFLLIFTLVISVQNNPEKILQHSEKDAVILQDLLSLSVARLILQYKGMNHGI